MTDLLLRMLLGVTVGLALTLLLRRPARRAFGAGPAFTLWLLPLVLALAPALPLPHGLTPTANVWTLPVLVVASHGAVAAQTSSALGWGGWLTFLWLAGAVIGMVRLALRYGRLLHGVRRAPAEWANWLPQGASRNIALRQHVAGPAVLCALPRPLLLLPSDFATRFGNAATCELVLRHELTHLRRGDAWWSLAMEAASALLWFHPLAWLARSRFRLDQELACDAAALRQVPQHTARYARALLDSVAAQPVPALIPWLAEPQLKERIAMLAQKVPGALRRRAGFVAVGALFVGGLFAMSGQAAAVPGSLAAPANGAASGRAPLTLLLPGTTDAKAQASTQASVDVSYKNRNPPAYPADAARNGEQGMVILDVTVNAKGDVAHLAIDPKGTTAPPELQAAALTAADGWKFNAGRKNGEAVGGVIRIPVEFSLKGMDGKPYVPPCDAHSQYVAQTKQCVKLVQPASSAR